MRTEVQTEKKWQNEKTKTEIKGAACFKDIYMLQFKYNYMAAT